MVNNLEQETNIEPKKEEQKNIDCIVNSYKSRFLEPILGNGEVTQRLEEGLYQILSGEDRMKVLSISIEDVFKRKGSPNCYTRTMNILSHLNVRTVGDILKLTERDILSTRNAGIKTVKYIKKELERYGLDIRKF